MKQKEVILFKSKVNKLSTNSKYTFRAIVRYAIILVIASLITFTLFQVKGPVQDGTAAKAAGSHIGVAVVLVLIGVSAVRMNQYYFNGSIFNISMVILSMGYAGFVAVFLRTLNVTETNEFYKFFYFVWPIFAVLVLWYIGLAIFERNTRPFLSKFMIWKSGSSVLFIGFLWATFAYLDAHTSYLGSSSYTGINTEDTIQFMHLVGIGSLLVIMFILWLVRKNIFKKRLIMEEMTKNISLSVAMMILLPITIWFAITYFKLPVYTNDYLLIIVDVISLGFALAFTILRKSRISSPSVTTVVYSISMLFIWLNKFGFEYISGIRLTHDWVLSITLTSLTLVMVMVFIKSNPASKALSFSQLMFITFVAIFVLIEWTMSGWPTARDSLNLTLQIFGISYDEMLNTFVLFSAMALVTSAILGWYRVQAVINHNLQKKIRSEKGGQNG